MTDESHPRLQWDVAYPDRLSRLLIFFKWLLAIPHYIALVVLGFVAWIFTVIGFFAILITGNYPRGMWNFVVGTLRWTSRVEAYLFLQRDEYPPFSFDGEFPASLTLEYPEHMTRLLVLVKWLLAIPHYIALWVLGIIYEVVLFISWFAILFTGRYPRAFFDFITGYVRWRNRVAAYLLLLTDDYPPFSLSDGAGSANPLAPLQPQTPSYR